MAIGDSAEDLQKNFEKLQRLANQLNKDFSSFNLRAITDDAETVKELLSIWQTELNDSRESLDSISSSFRDVVQQISKSNIGLNVTKASFRKLTGLAEDISLHQAGINKLNKDDLQSIQSKIAKEKKLLELNISTLKIRKAELESQRRQNPQSEEIKKNLNKVNEALAESTSIIDESNSAYKDLLINIKTIEREQDVFNGKLGLSSHLVEGIGGTLDKLGLEGLSGKLGLDDAKKKMEEIASVQTKQQLLTEEINNLNARGLSSAQIKAGFGGKELKEKQKILDLTNAEANALKANNGKLSVMSAGLKSMGSSLGKNLVDPAFLMTQMAEALKIADDGAGDMAKKMNLTYGEALNTRRELGNMAASSGDIALNTKNLQESYMAVGAALGTNAMLNEKDLTTMTKLVSQAGFQHSELMEIEKLSLSQNKSLKDNTKEILGGAKAYASRNGIIVNEKEVLKEVNKMSASLKLSLGGSATKMAEAVVQAKMFGLTLEQAEKMSSSLLQFESSIESELSAELLTGKELNFEKARQLALEGKTAEAAAEVARQVGSSKDFTKMNVIQQEALAKAAGMERDELAQSLIDKEAMVALTGVEGDTAKERYNTLRKTMTAQEAAAKLGDETLANQMEQQSVQERFAQATEKLKEVFIQIAEPVLAIVSPLVNLLNVVLPGISIILQSIIYPIQLLADGFNELFTLSGGFTDHLLGALKLLGGIAGTYFLIKTYQAIANRQAILGNALESSKLSILIAQAAAKAIANPFAALAGLALAGIIAAGIYSMVKGNDIMSSGDGSSGYGKRTLFGPEGAIQLNNKDTVIAGTDLFKKGDDVMSAPKDTLKVSNQTSPSPKPPDTNTQLLEEMKKQNYLREQSNRQNKTVSTLRIQ